MFLYKYFFGTKLIFRVKSKAASYNSEKYILVLKNKKWLYPKEHGIIFRRWKYEYRRNNEVN